jgi:serine/threonine protein kinase
MSTLELEPLTRTDHRLRLEDLGQLTPIGRRGGQGRVYRPANVPAPLAATPVVVKLYRRPPSGAAAERLADMVEWGRSLEPAARRRLHSVAAWPLAIVTRGQIPTGTAMHDVSGRFEIPFVMPSGRRERVLLSLEHLLGSDDYLQLRGLGVQLDTTMRLRVAERIGGALAFLHRHAIVACDIAPNNLLIAFGVDGPEVCFIDCDSMVLHGRQALASVQTADWQIPPDFSESPRTRAADAYKLGLIVLRLLARSHDARAVSPYARHVPAELRPLLARALSPDPANRPPAGEWQRALRELSGRPALNRLYPGPTPTPRVRPVQPRHELRPSPATVRAPTPAPPPMRPRGGRHPMSLAWLALAAVILWLLLARVFTAAAPPSSGSGFGSGTPGPTGNALPYYYPSGPGSAR